MATVTEPILRAASPVLPLEQTFVLANVDWPTYVAIADALPDQHVRITYDGERLELMTTSPAHARCSRLLGRFVIVLTEEFELPVASYGDMTCRREQSQRGFEPDECFYITNVEQVLGKAVLDFEVDPPPDLGLKVDITRSSLNRLEIYARIRVPEVWRYDEKQLVVYHLNQHGGYEPATESHYFPGIPLAELADWLARRNDVDENTLVREFRAWVQEQRQS